MTEKPKTETATAYQKIAVDETVQVQLSSVTMRNADLEKENVQLKDENKALKTQNIQLASVIETDLKADWMVKVMAISDYKQADLEPKNAKELKDMYATLSRGKGTDTVTSHYKSIHAGSDSQAGRTTVGDLFGKSRKEILAMQGDF